MTRVDGAQGGSKRPATAPADPNGAAQTTARTTTATTATGEAANRVAAVRAIIRACRLLERASGELTIAQYRVLTAIADGEHRASRVAARLNLGKPAVSLTVAGLCDRGLLMREWAESDQRVSTLRLTRAGRVALRVAEAAMVVRLDDLLDRAPDRDALLEALNVLSTVIEARLDEIHPRRLSS